MTAQTETAGKIPLAVRDLNWIINAPFLLEDRPDPDLAALPETRIFLRNLQENPAPLLAHLEHLNRHTLGSYFEHLVVFWLKNLPSVTILATNLQIFDDKTTIGEFDLLFTHGKRTYHWELAIKFYLNIGRGFRESDFVGPRLQDNLDRKLTRLFGHQLQLGEKPEARDRLHQLSIRSIHPFPWVKGALFQPYGNDHWPSQSLPKRISRTCLQGRWLRITELDAAAFPEFDYFLFPQKPNWLAARYYPDEAHMGGKRELEEMALHALKKRPSPLLAYLLAETSDRDLKILERLFIVPERWAV